MGDLLEEALRQQDLPRSALKGLASIELKRNEPGLRQLAARLGLPLVFFSAADLARFEPRLSHRSALAHRHSGCYGVAESAALALAEHMGAGIAHLHVPRCSSARATLALAMAEQNLR
ncbi:cobalamin biosynthesis protein CbiG [compost metagenome]